MTRAFGIDISKWNTSADGTVMVNFDVIKAHAEKVIFIAARAGVSWGYEDPCFAYYWAEMDRIRVCRIAYHVPYFGESDLANYRTPLPYPLYTPEHPGPPMLPAGVSNYLIHQTGYRCKSIGASALYYMDYNRWNGNNADVARYFGYSIFSDPKPEEVIDPDPVEDEPFFQAKCIVASLYKRFGPGVSYPKEGYLVMGDIVNVYQVKVGWYHIEKAKQVWCSGGSQYMQKQ